MEASSNIKNYRREQCEHCPTPCEYQRDDAFRANGDNACPKRRWMSYESNPRQWRGFGDAVASVAQPIAGVIDRAAGSVGIKTNVKGCSACAKRREMFNKYLPFPGNRSNG